MIYWSKIKEDSFFCPVCFNGKSIKLLDCSDQEEVEKLGPEKFACFNCGYIEDTSKFLYENEAKNTKRTKLIDKML